MYANDANPPKLWTIIKTIIKWGLIILFLPILLPILLILISGYQYYFGYNEFRNIQPFYSELWHNPTGPTPRVTRCWMYRDLIKNHLHFGMTYRAVVELLGSSIECTSYYAHPELKSITYFIGNCTSDMLGDLSPWNQQRTDFLILFFDHSEKLVAFHGEPYLWKEDLQHDKNISMKNLEQLLTYDGTKYYRFKTEADGSGHREYCNKGEKDCSILSCPAEARCNKEDVKTKWGYEVW